MTSEYIRDRFAELGADVELSDIESRITILTDQFKVPAQEAEKSVVSYLLRSNGIERSDYYTEYGAKDTVSVADLPQEDGIWANLRVKVADIWENTSEYMQQVGIIGDETGRTKFVLWKNAGKPPMIEGKSYLIENVVTNLYNERISITFNKTSTITEIEDDIEVGNTTTEYTGAMVSIKSNSGLIKRCPVCNRKTFSGACEAHGDVDGINDIRIMAILDNGTDTQDIMFNTEMTEKVWGHTLEEATKMATDSLDAEVVLEDMRNVLVGRYYIVSGNDVDTMILVQKCEAI